MDLNIYKDNQFKEININYLPLKCFSFLSKWFNEINKAVKIFGLLLNSILFTLILFKCCCCKEKNDK